MSSEEKKFLVTGGAGFIGTNLVRRLLARRFFVSVLDNFVTGKRENIRDLRGNENFKLIEGDVRNKRTVFDAVQNMDVVVHCAAIPGVDESVKNPITTSDVIIRGTLNVLEAARRENVEKIVFASSAAVYGSEVYPLIDEEHPKNPLSPYGTSKLAAEGFCVVFHRLYGVPTVCLRYGSSYGPYQCVARSHEGKVIGGAVIPRFVDRVINNLPPVIEGDGGQSRQFIYVEDIVTATMLAIEIEGISGEAFNISSEEEITIKDLAYLVIRIVGKQGEIEPTYAPPRPGDIKRSTLAIEKARRMIGFYPRIKLEDGIKEYMEWLKINARK